MYKRYRIMIQIYDDPHWYYYGGTDKKTGKMILLKDDDKAIKYQNEGLALYNARKLKGKKFPALIKDWEIDD